MHILQSNLGRLRRAQDLHLQTIQENEVDLMVVAEPYRIPDAHLGGGVGGVRSRGPAGARQRIRRGRVRGNGDGGRVRVAQLPILSVRGVPGRGGRLC